MYDLGNEELQALAELLKSKKMFRYQANNQSQCQLFEKEFSSYLQSGPSLLVSSGTNALLNALMSLGIGAGDEVLIPAFTFVATPAAVIQAGAKPVIVNINDSLTMCPEDLKKKITPETKAVIPVHMDGLPCDMEKISALAKEHNLLLIEDVAQASGGSFRGRKLGTFGDAGCFSFNAEKIISCGEGGAVVFHEESIFRKGLLNHDPGISFGLTYKDYLKAEQPVAGISMRASEISGALMRVQLSKLDRILGNLRERKEILVNELKLNGVDIVHALDPQGDCGTSLHLKITDPMKAAFICKDLLDAGIVAVPLNSRPAHNVLQWIDLLRLSQDEKKLQLNDLSSSRFILASVLKIFIRPDWTTEETSAKAKEVVIKLQK